MRNKQNGAVLKWLLKRHLYLAVLAFTVVFAMIPLHGMMKVSTVRSFIGERGGETALEPWRVFYYTQEISRNFLFSPLNLEVTCLIFGGLGFGSAMALFGHLFSRKQSMLYAGLPMTRNRDYLNRTLCFLILVEAPVLFSTLAYPLMAAASGMGKYFNTGLYFSEAAALNLTVLYGWAVGALSAQVFGNLWAAVLGGLLTGGSLEAVFGSWYSVAGWYLHTMNRENPTHLMTSWSPLVSLYKGLYRADAFNWLPGAAAVLILVLLARAAALRNRPERAGSTLNLQAADRPLRVWTAVVGGSVGGWLFGRALEPEISLYLGLILGAAFAAVACRMLTEQNIRVGSRGWSLPAVCLGVMLLCCFGLRTDPFGYDSWLPEPSQVEAFSYRSQWADDSLGTVTVFREADTLAASARWTGAMRDRMAESRRKEPFQKFPDVGVTVRWDLKGGGSAVRQYRLPENEGDVLAAVRTLADSAEYRTQAAEQIPDYRYAVGSGGLQFNLGLEDEDFREVFGFSPSLNWEKIKTQALREALKADLAERSWEDMQGLRVARLSFYDTDDETGAYFSSRSYSVFPSDERTIRALWGNQADAVLAFLRGGWADSEDVLAFRCGFRIEDGEMLLTDFSAAASPDEARSWVARTTGCDDPVLTAPEKDDVSYRIYTKTGVRRWLEYHDSEDLLNEPDLLSRLPEYTDVYSYTDLRERAD